MESSTPIPSQGDPERTRREVPAPGSIARQAGEDSRLALYEEAWRLHGWNCLWNVRRVERPTADDCEAVARALRHNGSLEACLLADRLREAVVAAD